MYGQGSTFGWGDTEQTKLICTNIYSNINLFVIQQQQNLGRRFGSS